MIVLRLLAVIIFSALLTGCDVKEDVKALKADIEALKVYLASFPPPRACQPPGEHTAWSCHYQLEITRVINRAKGLFSGKVAKDVVEKGAKDCMNYKDKNPGPQTCPNPDRYVYREFTFTVDGDTSGLDKGVTARFVSDPYTNHLMRTTDQMKMRP